MKDPAQFNGDSRGLKPVLKSTPKKVGEQEPLSGRRGKETLKKYMAF